MPLSMAGFEVTTEIGRENACRELLYLANSERMGKGEWRMYFQPSP